MTNFIFMLTEHDRTVSNAHEVYEEIKNTGLRYVGFKDIGLPFEQLKELTEVMHEGSQQVMLEVVSPVKEEELRAAHHAIELGVDYLLGGTHAEEVGKIIEGTDIQYFPFPGKIVGHPSQLKGSLEEIVESARNLADTNHVHGLDLLAYRHHGNVEEIIEGVVKAVQIPVIAAGSIDSDEKIRTVMQAGVWGFTMGSALFDGSYLKNTEGSLASKIEHILKLTKKY